MRQMKMLGIGVSLVAVLLMFAGYASATSYTSTATGGAWTDGSTWVGGVAPSAGDTGTIVATATVTISGSLNETANLYGTLTLTAPGSFAGLQYLNLEGGTLNLNGTCYNWATNFSTINVDVDSNVVGTGGNPGGGGPNRFGTVNGVVPSPGPNSVLLVGSHNLTLTGLNEFRPKANSTSSGNETYSGTYIVNAVAGSVMFLERAIISSNWATGNYALASGSTVQMGYGNSSDTNETYAHTLSGSGTWTIPYAGIKLTLASGAVVRPGAANAADAATLTLGGTGYNYEFKSGSDVQMDITSASTNDLLLFPTATSSAVVTIDSGAILDVNLFTPGVTTVISNMVLWDANYTNVTLTGDYATGGGVINYNNAAGWTGLSVVESGKQILFSGTYTVAAIPEPATLLLVGTGVLGVFGYIRRRRMS